MKKQDNQQVGDLPVGLSQPAIRALTGAGITSLAQLTKFSEADIKKLHGMGPNAIRQLHDALSAKGLSFRAGKRESDAD